MGVYLIVSSAIVCEEPPAFRSSLHQFLVKDTRDAHGGESSICSDHIIEASTLALGNELFSVRGLGSYDLCNLGQLFPLFVSTALVSIVREDDVEVLEDEQDDLAELENLRLRHDCAFVGRVQRKK